jgi:hypothetical protein
MVRYKGIMEQALATGEKEKDTVENIAGMKEAVAKADSTLKEFEAGFTDCIELIAKHDSLIRASNSACPQFSSMCRLT